MSKASSSSDSSSSKSLASLASDLITKIKIEEDRVTKEKSEWEAYHEHHKKVDYKDGEVVELNVGGCLYATTVDTLRATVPGVKIDENGNWVCLGREEATRSHVLASLVSGNYKPVLDKNGRIFLDRDGKYFRFILNYLREGGQMDKVRLPKDNKLAMDMLADEADFLSLDHLKLAITIPHLEVTANQKGSSITDSTIVSSAQMTQLKSWLGQQKLKLLWRGSRDGFGAATFHAKCDNQGPTLTIIKSNTGNIFGGYASQSWTQGGAKRAAGSWLFVLSQGRQGKAKGQQIDSTLAQTGQYNANNGYYGGNNGYDLYDHGSYGPSFGGYSSTYELLVSSACNVSSCQSTLNGYVYSRTTSSGQTLSSLNGQQSSFTVLEIEVYAVSS